MKRLLLIALALFSGLCSAQTFKVQNLDVLGTSTLTGLASFTVRPQFNGNTPWDSGNFNPGSYLTTATAAATYAPLASPTFTGTVTIPAGASIAGYAPLASPAFTGVPTAPTAATGTNTTQIATMHAIVAHAPCQSIIDYGGNNGGAVDNLAAMTAAVAAQPSGDVCVYFPPGKYLFSGTYTYTIPASSSVTIIGAGADLTNLYWASGSGLVLNHTGAFASAHIRDMSFLTGSVQTGDALTFNQLSASIPNPGNSAQSDITNVTCRGNDGYLVTDVWTDCIDIKSVSYINMTNVSITGAISGNGVNLQATSGANGVVYNIQGCNFSYLQNGLIYGNYIQGVTVNQSNFTGGPVGIISPTSTVGTSQLSVVNSQFNLTGYAFLFQTSVPATSIIGNYIIQQVPSAIGISIFQPGLYQIVGNTFNGTLAAGQIGISFSSAAAAGTITGNTFYHYPTAIFLPAGTGGVNVQSNAYVLNTVDINNAGANTIGGSSP